MTHDMTAVNPLQQPFTLAEPQLFSCRAAALQHHLGVKESQKKSYTASRYHDPFPISLPTISLKQQSGHESAPICRGNQPSNTNYSAVLGSAMLTLRFQ